MNCRHLFSLILLTFFLSVGVADHSNDCVHTLYVKTGSIIRAGTDSKISLALGDATGDSVWIPDLSQWGLMGPDHDNFEMSNLDIFSGRGHCFGSPICRLNLTSDGSGSHPGWFVDYVEVTSTGPHIACSQSLFKVYQWLALDAPAYDLSAIIDGCQAKDNYFGSGPSIVEKPTKAEA